MLKSDLHPPHGGPASDPVLYGVAAALADLFPPVETTREPPDPEGRSDEAASDGPGRD